jgi:hypothetical protein
LKSLTDKNAELKCKFEKLFYANMKKQLFLTFSIILFTNIITSQENNETSFFNHFNSFFDNEIKHQGIKGDWIFRLNEITGIHKFDFNNDTFIDVFIEFNAVPVEGGGVTNYYAVLFKNMGNKKFSLVNYIETNGIKYAKYQNNLFIFKSTQAYPKISQLKKYKLINSKFVLFN